MFIVVREIPRAASRRSWAISWTRFSTRPCSGAQNEASAADKQRCLSRMGANRARNAVFWHPVFRAPRARPIPARAARPGNFRSVSRRAKGPTYPQGSPAPRTGRIHDPWIGPSALLILFPSCPWSSKDREPNVRKDRKPEYGIPRSFRAIRGLSLPFRRLHRMSHFGGISRIARCHIAGHCNPDGAPLPPTATVRLAAASQRRSWTVATFSGSPSLASRTSGDACPYLPAATFSAQRRRRRIMRKPSAPSSVADGSGTEVIQMRSC